MPKRFYSKRALPDPQVAARYARWSAGIVAAVLLLVLAGCGRTQTPDAPAPPDTEAPDTEAPAPPPAAPPSDDTAGADTLGSWRITDLDVAHTPGSPVVLRAVRTAAHDGYDRIVFEFEGTAMPGYHLEYVDRPVRACGSGNVVALTGDGTLQVRMSPARAHTEAGEATVAERDRTPDLPVVKMLNLTCDFEADVTWVAAVTAPNPYRVTELRGPSRLVVDVRH